MIVSLSKTGAANASSGCLVQPALEAAWPWTHFARGKKSLLLLRASTEENRSC